MRATVLHAPVTSASTMSRLRSCTTTATPSCASSPPASAGPTCGPIAASTRSTGRSASATSSSASSSRSAPGVSTLKRGRLRHRAVRVLRQHLRAVRARRAHLVRPGRLLGRPRPPGSSRRRRSGRARTRAARRRHARRDQAQPSQEMVAHLLTLSDVFPTGHHAAVSAGVTAGSTVAVVGDGAVGLSAVLAAKRLGAGRIVAMSRHEDRQQLAREFGADEVVAERGKEGAASRPRDARRHRRRLRARVRRHDREHEAGHAVDPSGRPGRLRRRAARRRAQRPGDVRSQHRHRRAASRPRAPTSRSCCPTCCPARCPPAGSST